MFFESQQNRLLNSLLWSSLVTEAAFSNSYHNKLIKYSPFKETVIFMVVNSFLMDLLSRKKEKDKETHIWFYNPDNEEAFNINTLMVNKIKYNTIKENVKI